jgi:flagellar biosynthesis protein FlhG
MSQDQAETLRRLFWDRARAGSGSGADPSVWVVSSGRPGAGTTFLVTALGAQLSRAGLRVLLIDGTHGVARMDLPAIVPSIIEVEKGLSRLAPEAAVEGGNEPHSPEFDVILIDTGASDDDRAIALHNPRFKSVVILTPETGDVPDAYGLVKELRNRRGITRASVIVNSVADGREGQTAYRKLATVADRFLDIQLDYLGHCVHDEKITQHVLNEKNLLNLDRGTRAFPCLELLSKRMQSEFAERLLRVGSRSVGRNMSGFWGTFTEVSR